MKITATNGNARNGIKGQLVRFVRRNGECADLVHLKAGGGLRRKKYREGLTQAAHWAYRREALERVSPNGAPISAQAFALADLFATSKARLSIRHNRRFP